jgi:hypothetical protein
MSNVINLDITASNQPLISGDFALSAAESGVRLKGFGPLDLARILMGTVTSATPASPYLSNVVRLAAGAGIGAQAGVSYGQGNFIYRAFKPKAWSRMRTGPNAADIQDVRLYGCFLPQGAGQNNNDTLPYDACGFQFSTVRGDTNWQCISSTGGVQTTVNSGIAVAVDTEYQFAIDMSDPSKIDYYINGTLITSITTNLPGLYQELFLMPSYIFSQVNAVKTVQFVSTYIQVG